MILSACASNDKQPSPKKIITHEQQLQNELVKHPDSLLILENLVQHYRENGNYDTAIAIINNAVKKIA